MSAKPRSEDEPCEPGGGRRAGLWIVALALVVRLVYLVEISDAPTFRLPIVDSLVYCRAAAGLAAGSGFGDAFFFQPFLYPFWLAGVFLATGTSLVAARMIQALIGCATCLLAWRLGCRLYGGRAGAAAGVVTALYGPLVFFEAELLAAGPAAFLCVALVLLFLRASGTSSVRLYLLLGLCGAAAVLLRPLFLPPLLAAGCWLVVKRWRFAGRWRIEGRAAWTALVLGAAVPLIAVAVLNRSVTGHFGFLPSSGGLNLYIGNNPDSEQTVTVRPGSGWSDLIDLPKRHGRDGTMWDRQDFFRERAINYAAGEPGHFLAGLGRKGLQFASSREMPRNVDPYLFREWSVLLSVLLWRAGAFGFPFGLLLPLAVAGIFLRRRETPLVLPLFVVFWAGSVIAVFVAARYRVPIVPLLAAPAGAGIIGLWQAFRSGPRHRAVVAAGLAALVLVAGTLPGPYAAEKIDYEPELHCCLAESLQHAGCPEEALAAFDRAIALDGMNADTHVNRATLLIALNRFDEAIAACRRALVLRPDLAQAHCNLAALLIEREDRDAAREHCLKGLAIRPHEEAFHFNLARICAEEGDDAGAIAHLEAFLKQDDTNADVHAELARLLEKVGHSGKAAEHYDRAAELASGTDGVEALSGLGRILLREGRHADAAARFREALRRRPGDAGLLVGLAEATAGLGKVEAALEILTELRRTDPVSAAQAILLGRLLLDAGRADEAVLPLSQAAALAPGDPAVRSLFAEALSATGRFDDATDEARAAAARAGELGDSAQARRFAEQAASYEEGRPWRSTGSRR